MHQTGIWIDGTHAFIVDQTEAGISCRHIEAEVEYQPREEGEGKRFTRFGDQFFSNEKRMERRIAEQKAAYKL